MKSLQMLPDSHKARTNEASTKKQKKFFPCFLIISGVIFE